MSWDQLSSAAFCDAGCTMMRTSIISLIAWLTSAPFYSKASQLFHMHISHQIFIHTPSQIV